MNTTYKVLNPSFGNFGWILAAVVALASVTGQASAARVVHDAPFHLTVRVTSDGQWLNVFVTYSSPYSLNRYRHRLQRYLHGWPERTPHDWQPESEPAPMESLQITEEDFAKNGLKVRICALGEELTACSAPVNWTKPVDKVTTVPGSDVSDTLPRKRDADAVTNY